MYALGLIIFIYFRGWVGESDASGTTLRVLSSIPLTVVGSNVSIYCQENVHNLAWWLASFQTTQRNESLKYESFRCYKFIIREMPIRWLNQKVRIWKRKEKKTGNT